MSKSFERFAAIVFYCLVFFLLAKPIASGQTITGSVRGIVADPSGAMVPGANVTASNVATGVSHNTLSDSNGAYNIQFLPIGKYTIKATASGFNTASIGPFNLETDQIANVNVKLQVGEASTTVTVSSQLAPILNTETSSLSVTFSANTIASIPLNGRNFASVTQFMPGSVSPQPTGFTGTNATERATGSGGSPSFNGNRQQTNSYLLDGGDINESFSNTVGYNPAPEALGEIKIITSNADAEYGNVNGGSILLSTKNGTNQFHGSIYEFIESEVLDANTWSNNFSKVAKSSYTQNVFGATIGGPVIKNRLFFFADYEGVRYHTGGQGTASVAPVAFRQGDFSLLATKKIQLYDSQNGFAPFANNRGVPINNPVATFLFAHPEAYPLPNQSPTDGIAQNNYLGYQKSFRQNNQGDIRIDYTVSSKDSIVGRYSYGDAFDGVIHAVLPISFPSADNYPSQNIVLNWTHIFSNAIVNEARASYSRLVYIGGDETDPSGLFGNNGNSKVGIPGTQSGLGFSEQQMMSGTVGSFGTLGGQYAKVDNTFTYADNLTWQHGHHVSKFGAQFVRYQQNNFDPGNEGTLGVFQYTGQFTGNPGRGETTGYPFADFELNYADFAGLGGIRGYTGQRQWRDAYFVQDDWKIRPNLTLNLGGRYEFSQPIYEVNNKEVNVNLSNPSLGTAGLEYAGQNGNSRALYDPVYTNLMPRIGFAYNPKVRLVIRGGYGSTTTLEGTGSSLRLTQNPPFLESFFSTALPPGTSSGGAPLSVRNGFASAANTAPVANTQFFAWAKNLRPSYIQEFSLTAEYEIDDQTSFQVGYVGQTGQHLIVPQNGNQWPSPCSQSCTNGPFYNLVGQTGVVKVTQSEGMSNYNALQAIWRRRQKNGVEYTVNYTYAKSLTNNPGFYGVPGVLGASSYWQNAYNPGADYGPSGFDVRHNLTATGVFELPFGHGKRYGGSWNNVVNQAIGGWKIAGSAMLYSGFPITITSPNNANVNALTARANRYKSLKIVHRTTHNWFGTDPSATPCPEISNNICAYGSELPNSFGTASVGSERGPGYREIDLSLYKAFAITESQRINFRTDFFNAFNFASYADPSNLVTTTNFGQITSTRSPQRQIQLSASYQF